MTSYVFITGGVVSSLGKGITSACLGAILEARGLSISMIKLAAGMGSSKKKLGMLNHSARISVFMIGMLMLTIARDTAT